MRKLLMHPLFLLFISPTSFHSTVGNAQGGGWPILKGPCLGQAPPGVKSVTFAPGLISKEDSYELNSVFSADGELRSSPPGLHATRRRSAVSLLWATEINMPFRLST